MSLRLTALVTVPVLTLGLVGCADAGGGEPGGETLTIYSGRNEGLVDPILDKLEKQVGVDVEVRYAGTPEMAAQLLEEGESTDADIFFSQDAGALAALADAGMLADLDASVLDLVDDKYEDAEGRWVATSARARVLAYNPELAPDVPQLTTIDQLLDEKYRGTIGFAPTNASFHAFVTALRVDKGEEGAKKWLEDFQALEPKAYEGNDDVLAAVDGGEVGVGLINHYYWYQEVAEVGADNVTARIHFLNSDDPGALINVAGVGILSGTDQPEAAEKAIEYLLSDEAQQYFADETAEYPVVEGITTTKHDLKPLSQLQGHTIDLNELDSLEQTLELLDEVGLT